MAKKIYLSAKIKDEKSKRKGMEVPSCMKLDADAFDDGFAFGYKECDRNSRVIIKPCEVDGHILVIGPPGSGKTFGMAIPTLAVWKNPIFAISIKDDLYNGWSCFDCNKDRPVEVFSFSEESTWRYDPFYLLREGDQDDLVQNACEIAEALIPISEDVREPFWKESARNVLIAAILFVYGPENKDGDLHGSFNHVMRLLSSKPIWKVVEEIQADGNDIAKMFISQLSGIKNPEDNKMVHGIAAELDACIKLFATDNRIISAFGSGEKMLRWEDLEHSSVILRVPEDKLDQWGRAIKLMCTQLIRTLERRPEIHGSNEKKLPPVLLLLDEFPRLGKMDIIMNAISTLRSRGVTICLMMQSIAQLDMIYGKAARRVIVDNCQYKAILGVNDPEDQEYFSEMVGSIRTVKKSVSKRIVEGIELGEKTITIAEDREPIIFPAEFASLGDEIVLLTPNEPSFLKVKKIYTFEEGSRWLDWDRLTILYYMDKLK